jgi:hypothetical protein
MRLVRTVARDIARYLELENILLTLILNYNLSLLNIFFLDDLPMSRIGDFTSLFLFEETGEFGVFAYLVSCGSSHAVYLALRRA